ncbi:hypothetical protein BJX63DRAFT_376077 [Aspergillus granulosus]|uniref:NACHT-NTPase and P-loop NTPases N-terminal domain-containing protein n=1 Tax=Aspergillus granulosus TaxID=176169 RepID=A0ABR4I5W4_9EURO
MASGFEILSLISSTITIIEITIEVYDAIEDLHGLPKAFQQVSDRLPLVKDILVDAKGQAKNTDSSTEATSPKSLLESCEKKAKELQNIFVGIAKESAGGKSVLSAYRSIVLKLGKKSRVETLMNDILKDLGVLAAHNLFQAATQKRVEEVEKARQELEKVPPSLSDSDFDEEPSSVKQTAGRDIYNFSGGSTLEKTDGNNYKAQGNMYIGTVSPEVPEKKT